MRGTRKDSYGGGRSSVRIPCKSYTASKAEAWAGCKLLPLLQTPSLASRDRFCVDMVHKRESIYTRELILEITL